MKRLHFGAAWYPEHWPVERWAEDIRLMKEAHFTVVRLAEFAWSTLEPAEGEFRFEWLEQAIALLAQSGISVVLGTPTAAPPAWLVQTYPQSLAVDEYGRRVQFGNRCHYCVNSPDFHRAVQRIVRAMAERFGNHPHVIGWQIDNEYNRVCYCEHCQAEFQAFLRVEYGTLDELNTRWTTAYWSQTYSDWAQIPLPIGPHNPGLMLAFRRFVTRSYRNFQKLQLDELRAHLPASVWVTHNFMNWFGAFDHYALSADLDLASWDWYIGSGHHDHLRSGAAHDLVRGYKRRNFWLMETQPGHVNWSNTNNALNKMEARAMAWHAVAHGADALLYWQWRSALNGQEQYHGTLVDQSGQPRPFYEEAQLIGDEFARVSELVIDSFVQAKIAILNCYESRWAIEFQRHNNAFDYVSYLEHWYRSLSANNLEIDVISADAALEGYKLVIAPALMVLDEQRVQRLRDFVQRGGRLVLTLRTGLKDRHNALLASRPPGPLAELAGVEVEEYYSLEHPIPVEGKLFQGSASVWAERLRLLGQPFTTVMARYGACNGWLDDQPAVVVNPFGAGFVYTVGAWLEDRSQEILVRQILRNAELKPFETPPTVEARTRIRPDGTRLYFIINHSRQEQTFTLPWPVTDHLTGQEFAQGPLTLYPYAVALLTRRD
ncbi:MAG: beta-galactosidase [Anaerolineae bacterium]|nr:MAG: beta-galactosidase [Anaerolineae bacterium]